jgi:predicted AAA+ superfamily ATPase
MHLPDDENIRFEYLKNIFDTIILRDVIHRNNIRDPRFLNDLLHFLADATGNLISANKISKFLKSQQINKNVALIINYLRSIEDAYFINNVKRIDIKGRKQFEVGEKYYFEDIGLRNAIVGYRIQDIEKIIENLVFLHLKNLGYKISIGDLGGKEIDFVAEKDNERIYIQVAYLLNGQETIEREFGNLLQINDNFPKLVISYDDFESKSTYKGIKHLSLLNFLKNF